MRVRNTMIKTRFTALLLVLSLAASLGAARLNPEAHLTNKST